MTLQSHPGYISGEKYGVMLQNKISVSVENNDLPIKKSEINVTVPEINGIKPKEVKVIAVQTQIISGESDVTSFTEDNYQYDSETGIVKITVNNSNEETQINENVEEIYLVTFIFENQELYKYVNTNGIDTKIATSAKIELYNDEELIVDIPETQTEIKTNETQGTIVDFYVLAPKNTVGKVQVYLNYEIDSNNNDVRTKKETSYITRYISTINSATLTDNMEFQQGIDKFLIEQEDEEALTTVSGENYTYNKTVKISENVFKKILGGENGEITLYDANDNVEEGTEKETIGTINKDTQIKDGYYVLDISSKNNNQLHIVTSEPVAEGQLIIDIEKAIKTDIGYSKSQFKEFNKMEISLNGKTSNSEVSAKVQVELGEPTSVANLTISRENLTTVVKNENVGIGIILDSSDLNYALYKEPTLKITLPSYISEVDLKQTEIVLANGLEIKGTPNVTYDSGAPVIDIEIEGIQEEYTVDALHKGTIIVLTVDLTVDSLTPTNSNKIIMEFTNKNEQSTNSKGTVETKLNFIAPTGVVAVNGIDDILSISNEGEEMEIPANANSKVSTVHGKVINNYDNAIDNIIVLGRFPVKDNKKIDTTESLGSTFSTTLKSNISVKGLEEGKYTVYYSENAEATIDVESSANGWSKERTENVKSYMIVVNDYEMITGDVVDFSYDVEIPANLKYNNIVYEMYKVYYNNKSTIGTMAESKTSAIIGITTGQGQELTVELKSTIDTVREGQIIKMIAQVKNIGSMVAENVKVNIPLPENITFVEYFIGNGFLEESETTKVIDVGTINPKETKQVSYYIKIDEDLTVIPEIQDTNNITKEESEKIENMNKFPKEIVNKVYITSDGLLGEQYSNEHILSIEDGKIALNIVTEASETEILKKGDVINYIINVKNISSSGTLNNTVVTIPLPNSIKYKSAVIKEYIDDEAGTTEGISYNEETNTVQINIKKLDFSKVIFLELEVKEYEGSITLMAKAKADGTEEHYSNILEYMSEIVNLKVSELTSTPRYVKEGEEITYSLTLTNKGKSVIHNICLSDVLPEELTFIKATYMYVGEQQVINTLNDGKVEVMIGQMAVEESIEIKLIAKAGLLADKNDKEIQNKITITANNYEGATTNSVKNIIEYNEEIREQGGATGTSNPTTPTDKRYKITGTAWIDEDRNGKREDIEEILSDITVMLLNKEDNSIVKDPDTKNQMITTTDNQGKYEFTNLPIGEYIAVFLYDAAKYSLTIYRQKDVDVSLNSDVISINITLDGKRTIAGTTDVIKITDDNARDIDIGVYISEKFDLKLDKFISKITLTTPTSGTKVYKEGNSKLEKVEVLEKNLGQSNVVIEYKIVVTNQGAVAGYAKKIVDYLPEGVGFNTELNKDWYLSENGNVYNASLENELIEPGESKQLTLIVTKKITEDSLGSLNNNAEIYESYNEQGLKDIDSTEGNKVQEEDDISKAEIILSIVTGKIIMYTTIALGVVAILAFGIMGIKRKVLNKRN